MKFPSLCYSSYISFSVVIAITLNCGAFADPKAVAGSKARLAPVSFLNQIEPILTRAGCNAGACHGSQFGKGGFKLSLAAYDPDLDYDAITRQARGRRISVTDAAQSLLLVKAALRAPHQGG